MSKVDITAIITLHNEGMLAHFSLLSLARAKAFAERQGLQVEIIGVLDNPSDETVACVRECSILDIIPVHVSHGDAGPARNSGIQAARGEWIGFLDGDDMWAENWLAAAYAMGAKDARPIIFHPQVNIVFGFHNYIFVHADMEEEDFELSILAMTNYWTALSFAKRQVYLSIPYRAIDPKLHIGFEDWDWNIETILNGYIHKTVPGTVHAIRSQSGSRVHRTTTRNALPSPTYLFQNLIMENDAKGVQT
jgi:glycosyltransferase involved in cell wall biosynthesis